MAIRVQELGDISDNLPQKAKLRPLKGEMEVYFWMILTLRFSLSGSAKFRGAFFQEMTPFHPF